ncbi:hypothetical protein GCM10010222_27010 [Streptomyces tanashiensis]|nr:hypothetical protein GCM10010222_27010 [Streptomyces tanashiensis]
MDTPRFAALLDMLREAEAVAWESVHGSDERTLRLHKLTADALRAAERLRAGEPCAGPECGRTVAYSGVGRPARYCSKRCRDRAAYRAARQRESERS